MQALRSAAPHFPWRTRAGFAVGDSISVGNPGNLEAATITTVAAGAIGVAAPLKMAHGAGEPIVRTSGNIQYRDLELAQDACAARPRDALRQGERADADRRW